MQPINDHGSIPAADRPLAGATTGALDSELAFEQAHVSRLYEQLDRLQVEAEQALVRATASPATGTPAARTERESFIRLYSGRLAQLRAVEQRLCFGRLDLDDGARRYIGRLGMSDDQRRDLLVDWRAPAAEPFYRATAAQPLGVVRRRQLSTSGRVVTNVQDEVLDLARFEADGVAGGHIVLGEGALFASLDAARSGRMRDIVATIQADQDRAIRAPMDGVFVVQGGPGTGKTAVALHRTAFLLYANRQRIAQRGVLLVGPNRVFLRYIDQVLPALGEADSVVMVTPGELYPGVRTVAVEVPAVARVKGDSRMAQVIAEAVRQRQRTIDRGRRLMVEKTAITLRPQDVLNARSHARRSGKPHNVARADFVAELLRVLVRQLASARGVELEVETRAHLMGELFESADVRRELNLCWGPVTPERLLRDLYADRTRLDAAGQRLSAAERAALARDRSAPWTVDDVALLDEAAELLGVDTTAPAADEAQRAADVAYADIVLDTFGTGDFMTAEQLAGRYEQSTTLGSVAERAANDREWSYGHIVVDEAQELSAMAWRVLMRRCPTRSMTIVGDVAQTGSAAGSRSWESTLRPHVQDRWHLAELTVNYRTPAQIMELAGAVVRAAGIDVRIPTSARTGPAEPQFTRLDDVGSPALVDVVRSERELIGAGTVGVIVSLADHVRVAALVTGALGAQVVTSDSEALSSPVSVLTVADCKGLEFDAVVIVEPAAITTESERGINDLYVALTRPTQRLHVVHTAPLPAGLTPA